MVRSLKRAGVVTGVLVLLSVAFRGPLFRAVFHFDDLHQRPSGRKLPDPTAARSITDDVPAPVNARIDRALDETARLLRFTTGPAPNDAASCRAGGTANCVGYAALFQDRCQRLLDSAGLSDRWQVLHLRGRLFCGPFNTHRLFSSPFWKDHDLCLVENPRTGQRVFVDPSLFDAAGIRRVCGPAN